MNNKLDSKKLTSTIDEKKYINDVIKYEITIWINTVSTNSKYNK